MKGYAINRLIPHLDTRPRVETVDEFDGIEAELGLFLPADYKTLMMLTNGGETRRPLTYIRFYPLDELLPRRKDGQPPGALEIATDDSNGYALDLTRNRNGADYPIVRYPLGETTREMTEEVSDNLRGFIERLLRRLSPVSPL